MLADRRRINGPPGGTSAPVYSKYIQKDATAQTERPSRIRQPNVLRKMCKSTARIFYQSLIPYSPEDWRHPFSFRIRVSRTRSLQSPQLQSSRSGIALHIRPETHMYGPRSAPSSQISAFLASHHTLHTRQVRSIRHQKEERLPPRLQRARSRCTSRDRVTRRDYWR